MFKPQTPPPPPVPEQPPPPPQQADAQGFISQRNMLRRSMNPTNKEQKGAGATAFKTLLGQ